jgi:hypothetical protein
MDRALQQKSNRNQVLETVNLTTQCNLKINHKYIFVEMFLKYCISLHFKHAIITYMLSH